jgi:hypothetical protein
MAYVFDISFSPWFGYLHFDVFTSVLLTHYALVLWVMRGMVNPIKGAFLMILFIFIFVFLWCLGIASMTIKSLVLPFLFLSLKF